VPLDVPRLPFRMKHAVVRTALRNGAVFEIPYSALDTAAKRNWWAATHEVVLVIGGGMDVADLRAPKDIGNLCV
jgi:ribonuclease P/MRP protein subunit RPP1